MFEYFLAFAIVLGAFLTYRWYIKPRRAMKHYAQCFRRQGLKVIEFPYKPIGAPYFEVFTNEFIQKQDSFYSHKNTFHAYDLAVSNVLTHPEICLLNPNLIKELLSLDKLTSIKKHNGPYEVLFSIVSNGIVLTEGNQWKKRKTMFSNVFNFDFINSQVPMMVELSEKVLNQLQESYWKGNPQRKQKKQVETQIFHLLIQYTSQVIMTGFLGMESVKESLKGELISDMILKLSYLGSNGLKDPLLIFFGTKFQKLRLRKSDRQFLNLLKQIDEILLAYVRNQRQKLVNDEKGQKCEKKQAKKTLVQLLLIQSNLNKLKGNATIIKDEEMIDEIKTFMIAGAETTSNFLTAMIFYTFEKPEVVERLRRQFSEVIKSDADINVENFKKLPYLDCVIHETQRVFCAGTGLFERQTTTKTTLGGVAIEEGVCFNAHWISNFYNPQIFENPKQFIPERWEKEESKKHLNLVSLIFSGGPRGCIGKNLALIEMKVMMIKFTQRYAKVTGPAIKNKILELQLAYHLVNNQATLTKQ